MFRIKNRQQAGFTLIEMLVIAPIVILAIGAFLTVIISMTGEVLSSRSSNTLAYSVQDAMNRIDQDVKQSSAFLAENSFSPSAGQGADDNTTKFVNIGGSYGPALILSTAVTNDNPVSATTGLVYLTDQPNACGDPLVTNNVPMTMNIVYFVKNDQNGIPSLWRRTVMPANYASAGCSSPWQRPSCSPGYTAPFCVTEDIKLVEGVSASSFKIDYLTSADSTTPDSVAVDTGATAPARQSAMQSAPTVGVTISASQTVAGRLIERSANLRTTRLETTASTIASTPIQSALSGPPTGLTATGSSGSQINVSWYAPSGVPTSYSLQYSRKSDFSSPTTINNITIPSASVTGLIAGTGYFFRVSATNSFGATNYSNGVLGYTTGNTHDWSVYTKLTGVSDWDRDGKNDVMGYKANGDVDLLLGNGNISFKGAILLANIGTGVRSFLGPGTPPGSTTPLLWWNDTAGAGNALKSDGQYGTTGGVIASAPAGSFSSCVDVFAAPNIFIGNTNVVVICRTSTFARWHLNSAGVATLNATLSSGWNTIAAADQMFGAGDFSVDTKGDLLYINSSSQLVFWQGDGAGYVTSTCCATGGWTSNRITGGWDYNGDRVPDVLRYYIPSNILYFYPSLGNGGIGSAVVVN